MPRQVAMLYAKDLELLGIGIQSGTYMAKNDQVVAILMKTGLNNALLHIVHSCQQY